MCAVIMVWTKAVGRRRQTEEEIAGFCVEIQCLCVCFGGGSRGNRDEVTQAGNLLDNDMSSRKGFGRTVKRNV